ncbi:MAG: cytochrome c nitrite reductase small subunit [Thermoflexales bacterium]|nr:cytochrome c nitrite reductase small subunit [Thermoflexales bacterium]
MTDPKPAPKSPTVRPPSRFRTLVMVAVFALAGIFAGIGGYTFVSAKGYSYLLDDPQACVNCHIMNDEYNAWTHSSHKTVATCNSCHVPHDFVGKYLTKLENGYSHSRAFTFMDFKEPIEMRPVSKDIVLKNCLECHNTMVSNITALHTDERSKVNCITCHRDVGHAAR